MRPEKPFIIMVSNVYEPVLGGISSYIKTLTKGLINNGYRVKVINYPSRLVMREYVGARGYSRPAFKLAFILLTLVKIFGIRIRNKYVIVHGHSTNFCLIVAAVSKLFGCRRIHTFHSPIKKDDAFIRLFQPHLEATVFVSIPHMESYLSTTRIKRLNIEIIPGGIDTNLFRNVTESEKKAIRKRYQALGIYENGPMVLFTGRITSEKGVHVLIESIPEIKRDIPDVQVLIAGAISDSSSAKEYIGRLRARVNELGIASCVSIVTNLSTMEMPDVYKMADVFACPSTWAEPFGISVVEAMASGIPVVASKTGGLPHLVINGKAGYVVEPGDSNALGERIAEILKDEKLHDEFSRNARKNAEDFHSLSHFTMAHINLYDSIIYGRPIDRD